MRRLLTSVFLLLILLLLPLTALADIPEGIWGKELTDAELLPLMRTAMTEAGVSAVICTRSDGSPVAVYDFGSGFCVARRSDGLLMLCCFKARGEILELTWHNDLLLSSAQPLSLSVSGPTWGDVPLPHLSLFDGDVLTLTMPLADGSRLELRARFMPNGWQVTGMSVLVCREDGSYSPALTLKEEALSPDICLSVCHPADWSADPE